MTLRPELIDELLKGYRKPEDLMGEGGVFKQLTQALIERCLSAELDTHLAEEKADFLAEGNAERPENRRNGYSEKTVKGEFGESEIGIPRVLLRRYRKGRNGAFEPQLIAKGQTHFNGFERKLWQNRSLDAICPIIYFDALVVKVLWLSMLTGLQNRGVKDIFIACVDGLTGFPEAIEAVFSQTTVQLRMAHRVRNSLSDVSDKDRKALAADLKTIYTAATETETEQALVDFAKRWHKQHPTISKSWINPWNRIIPFFAFPPDIRKAIYTTNAIESINMTLHKVLRNHRSFPTDESAMKVIYLAIANISKKWTMPIRDWKPALNRFAIEFEGRSPI